MSETPESYSAQEAEAEGVRPLSEEGLAGMKSATLEVMRRYGFEEILLYAKLVLRVLATLDAARAELERKEAEAAVLREALLFVQPYMEGAHFNRVDAREIIWAQARRALNTTQAGAALLERVRQLEEEVERLQVWRNAVVEYVDAADPEKGGSYVKARAYERLWGLVIEYRKDHQGTGAAGEEE